MFTDLLTFRSGLAVAFLLLVGCGSDLPPEPPTDLIVDVWVLDERGLPVPHVDVTWFSWFGADTVFPFPLWAGSDSTGLAALSTPLVDGLVPDSIRIGALPSECTGLGFQEARVAIPRHGSPRTVRITLPTIAPVAVVGPGESCGVGHAEWVPGVFAAFWVSLYIDSITSQVYGRWQIAFQESRRTEFGEFVGTYSAGALGLKLSPDPKFGVCVPRYRLLASVSVGDTVQTAYLQEDGGCPIYDIPFRLYAEDTPFFP